MQSHEVETLSVKQHDNQSLCQIGIDGSRNLIDSTDSISVFHEQLLQEEVQQRFYRYPKDTYVYLLKGQAYLNDAESEVLLKENQGLWLQANKVYRLVCLSSQVDLLIIHCPITNSADSFTAYLKPHSSGSGKRISSKSPVNRWILSQHPQVHIELESIPANYNEHLHYHRQSNQIIVNLNEHLIIEHDHKWLALRKFRGYIINSKTRHKIINPMNKISHVLSIYTPPQKKDRVLVVSKQKL